MRTLTLVVPAFLALVSAATAAGPACDLGRWVIAGKPLVASPEARKGGQGDAVEIAAGQGRIEGVCDAAPARLTPGKRGTKVAVDWNACRGLGGAPARLRAVVRGTECDKLRGTVVSRKVRLSRRIAARRTHGDDGDCRTGQATFDAIEARVFGAHGCRAAACHGVATSGGLDLRAGVALTSLVNAPASGAPGTMRVVPGDPDASFLWRKLTGQLAASEGNRMPSVGGPLSALELELVRAWIAAGAPQTGRVDGGPCLPHPAFEPAPPLPEPPGGMQLVLEGPTLAPGEELEGCSWVQLPNTSDFVVGSFEYSLNPGTHHFAVWEHMGNTPPELNVFRPRDTACIGGGARFGISLSGAPQAPYFVDSWPAGVGKVLPAGSYLGLNPHYYNEYDVPVPITVWINIHPVVGPVEHVADTLTSLNAQLNGESPYSLHIEPGTQRAHRLRFTNTDPKTMVIFQLSSHMHQRGVRFRAWRSDGTLFYTNTDWAHPFILDLAEPMRLAPGDWLDYECLQDNGVERTLRRCGDSPYDGGCRPGEPVTLRFGVSAEDEMCLLTGQYWLE